MTTLHHGFEVVENADGTVTMLDVPIFWACSRDDETYDEKYIAEAFDKCREWERNGHLPPMTIGHRRRDRPEPQGAGWWRATRVGVSCGQRAIFADLTFNAHTWTLVRDGLLPYRSAETIRPGMGEPEIASLALTDNEPYLKMPMTRARVANATHARETAATVGASVAPVMAFTAFGDRCHVTYEAPMAETTAAPEKPRVRVSGVTGKVAAFADDVLEKPGDAKAEKPPKPEPNPSEAPAAAEKGGLSEAVRLLTEFMAMPVPLQDVKAAISMLEEKLAQLKGATATDADAQDDEPDEPERDPNAPGARPSDDVAEPSGKNLPPANKKDPMNMTADNTTKTGAVDADALAKFAADQAVLKGRLDTFETERKQERAIFSAVKDLADFNIGSDPEAEVRKVVTEAGDGWEKSLALFTATVKKTAPKRHRSAATATVERISTDAYPAEVQALGCKTPEEGAAALRCFAAYGESPAKALVTFPQFFNANRALFGAPVR